MQMQIVSVPACIKKTKKISIANTSRSATRPRQPNYRPIRALLGLKMQKFPIDSHSNENFISPFSDRRGPPTPKRGEDTSGTRVRPHAKFGFYARGLSKNR